MRNVSEDMYEGDVSNPLTLNLYAYVHNNPLTNIDPTGHYCVSKDGNWAHGGSCDTAGSIYMGDDKYFSGYPVISDGYFTNRLGEYGPPSKSEQMNFHEWNRKDFALYLATAKDMAALSQDTMYGTPEQQNMQNFVNGVSELVGTILTFGVSGEAKGFFAE